MKFVIALIVGLFVIIVSSLIMWGVGSLIIFAFKINYTWTFLHGLAATFIYWILRGIFKSDKGE